MGTGDAIVELELGPAERLDGITRRVAQAILEARAGGARGLLVLVPAGVLPVPTTAERVVLARAWAAAADGRIRVAVVAPPALVDEERLGVVVAVGFGLDGNVFHDEAEARRWLARPA